MAITEYVHALGEGARKRHYHERRRGRVVAFAVQLEVELRGQWVPVVRYDMAHGQAHIDLYETPTRKTKHFLDLSPAEAMTLADEDIKENWKQFPRDQKFNAWARRLARRQRESGRPIVIVTINRVQPPKSRLIPPRLEIEAA